MQEMQETRVWSPGLGRSPGEENGNLLQYSSPEKIHGQRSPVGYHPQDHESDTTERLSTQDTVGSVTVILLCDCASHCFVLLLSLPSLILKYLHINKTGGTQVTANSS